MARPHIEFVQCQNIGWQEQANGADIKLLNADADSAAATLLVRYPAGWSTRAPIETAEEYFVLDGDISIDGAELPRHAYGFLPRDGESGTRSTIDGATLLLFRFAQDDPDTAAGIADPIQIDTRMMPWDVSTYDPALSHLRLARKVLRLGPNDSGRTFLLAGMPHGIPDEDAMPTETHRHAEEMFMIHGEMFAPEGVMRAGAYFYRPPHIVHGPHVSETGFFQIMRSPGANRIVTEWSQARRPLPIDAPYAPVLPTGTPAAWSAPWKPEPLY